MLININRPSPFPPITSLQPQCLHAVTHSLAQRRATMCFSFSAFRTLSIATGVVPPLPFAHRSRHSSPPHHGVPDAPKRSMPPVLAPALARGLARRHTQIHTPSVPASPFNAVFRHSMHGNTIQRKVWSRTANSGKLFFVTEGLRGQCKWGPKRVR